MTIEINDVVSAICTKFEAARHNELQTVYTVADNKEAKLAFDVLVAFGFDAKVYHDEEAKTSKLYVTLPAADQADQAKLSSVLAYANSLVSIKKNLDALCGDPALASQSAAYNITFSNAQPGGKQITVQINPAAAAQMAMQVQHNVPSQQAAHPHAPAGPRKSAKRFAAKPKEEGILTGPAVAKRIYPGQTNQQAQEDDSVLHQLNLYLRGNIATSSFAFLSILVFLAVIFGLFTSAKAFLCPDFATEEGKKNHSWYCRNPGDEPTTKDAIHDQLRQ